jgi:hypothetical protein
MELRRIAVDALIGRRKELMFRLFLSLRNVKILIKIGIAILRRV